MESAWLANRRLAADFKFSAGRKMRSGKDLAASLAIGFELISGKTIFMSIVYHELIGMYAE